MLQPNLARLGEAKHLRRLEETGEVDPLFLAHNVVDVGRMEDLPAQLDGSEIPRGVNAAAIRAPRDQPLAVRQRHHQGP